jgi:predicted nucleotidyltransferase component of viral defense system
MLDFEQIKSQYPEPLQGYERAILREYLQYKILQGLFESTFARQISFLGGTALRIVYGNQRFSEDIDLDQFGLGWKDFEDLIKNTVNLLSLEGFNVEVSKVAKTAFHCVIKFPKILFEHGISPLQEEKIRIQIDTAAQGYDYQPEAQILNKFDVFTQIRVTPLPTLLSQKIYTAVNRKRAKGRDFYDITFLLAQTRPDYDFLDLKIGITSPDHLRMWMLSHIEALDFDALGEDVSPFLINPREVKRVEMFRAFWQQADLA